MATLAVGAFTTTTVLAAGSKDSSVLSATALAAPADTKVSDSEASAIVRYCLDGELKAATTPEDLATGWVTRGVLRLPPDSERRWYVGSDGSTARPQDVAMNPSFAVVASQQGSGLVLRCAVERAATGGYVFLAGGLTRLPPATGSSALTSFPDLVVGDHLVVAQGTYTPSVAKVSLTGDDGSTAQANRSEGYYLGVVSRRGTSSAATGGIPSVVYAGASATAFDADGRLLARPGQPG